MKRVLSIIFGLVLVGCLTGCQSTKVETPVVEAPVEEVVEISFPTSLHIDVTDLTYLGNGKWDRKYLGAYEIPMDGKIEFDSPNDGLIIDTNKNPIIDGHNIGNEFGMNGKKIILEYFIYDDCVVLKRTSIWGPNTFSENKIGKKLEYGNTPVIIENDREIFFTFLTHAGSWITEKFYETEPIFANLKEVN